jgi:hypothetical protein
LKLESAIKGRTGAGLQLVSALDRGAKQPNGHVSLLDTGFPMLEQSQSAGKPGPPHHLVIKHLELDLTEHGGGQSGPA